MSEQIEEIPKAPATSRKPRARKTAPQAVEAPIETVAEPEPDAEQESGWPTEDAHWLVLRTSGQGVLAEQPVLVRVQACRICYGLVDHEGYEEHLVWHARRG